jgi:hypothetical protein
LSDAKDIRVLAETAAFRGGAGAYADNIRTLRGEM